MQKIAPDEWKQLFELLDTALELPPDEQQAWLETLDPSRAALKPALRDLLAKHANLEVHDTFSGPPHFTDVGEVVSPGAQPKSGDLVGAYRLVRELGAGGMGTVWLAERADGTFKRMVALKLPHVTWIGGLAERMVRERDILAGLEHPNIARLYDAGVDQAGRPFMAMEYIEGVPIDRFCADRGLSIRARLVLLMDVARAVSQAHARLIVHRDLKPANILVSADGVPHLLDFGIARLIEDDAAVPKRLTRAAAGPLTPDYASPEQIRGDALGTATDIYSLGVVMFEVLTGKLPGKPARAENPREAPLASALAGDPGVRRDLRGDLDAIMGKALRLDPADRYPTVDALAQDIARYLRGVPVQARPDSAAYRLGKLLRRNKGATAAAAAVFASLIGGIAVARWQAGEAAASAEQARRHADVAERQAARAENVKRFVLSIFENADFDAGGNTSTTALDLLTRAQERIDAELADDPAIAVELMTSVGYSLIGLDQMEKATDLLRRAVELGEKRLKPEDALTAAARVTYAEALVGNSKLEEAEQMLQLAIEDSRRSDHPKVLADALRWMSDLRTKQGRDADAEALANESVQVAEARLAPAEPKLRMELYINQYGAWRANLRADSVVPAKKAYELALKLDRDKPSLGALVARLQYASALGDGGDFAASVRELSAVVDQMSAITGPDHRLTLIAMTRLGVAQAAYGEPEEGIATIRRSMVPYTVAPLSSMIRDVGIGHLQLGSTLSNAGANTEALNELDEAVIALTKALGEQHLTTQSAKSLRAVALARSGRSVEAGAEIRRLQIPDTATDYNRAEFEARRAVVLGLGGRHQDADVAFEKALPALAQQALGGSRLGYARSLAAAAESALALGNRTRAQAYLEQSEGILRSLQRPQSAELTRVSGALERARSAPAPGNLH